MPDQDTLFVGEREDGSCVVHVERVGRRRKTLPLRLTVMNHSPSGFEWGYAGSGPAQLALALLIEAFPDKPSDWCVRLHQEFKRKIVTNLPRSRWTLTISHVRQTALDIAATLGVDHGDSPQEA